MSEQFANLCAIRPAIPTNIMTYNQNAEVLIEWDQPDDNGSPITHYTIFIQTKQNTYEQELNNCDGTDSDIVSTASCVVTLADL